MRVAPCLLLIVVCLSPVGCKSFGKKDAGTASAGGRGPSSDATLARGAAPTPSAPLPPANPGDGGALLAGQILDSSNRRLPGAFIQVADSAEASRRSAPIEVAADRDGYFIIQGLQANRRYQLTARARDGSHHLTGSVWATPPDPKLVIRLNDDPTSPAAYAPPGAANRPSAAEQGWSPTPPAPHRAAELGAPVSPYDSVRPSGPIDPPPPDAPPSGPPAQASPLEPRTRIRPENTADAPVAQNDSPTMDIPGRGRNTAPPPGYPGQWAPAPIAVPSVAPAFGPPRVPSCVLTGQTLHNFALNDLSGQPWEYRQRRGRLVLVDFWGTWCVHCLHAVPHLNIMQERYGPSGLEVIGIAYETGTPQEQVRKVNDVRQRLRMNYRILLGGDREKDPVCKQFGVKAWPTLVLLDDTGRIVWRGEGFDAQHLRELDVVIQQRLAMR